MSNDLILARVYLVRHGETAENYNGIIQGQSDTHLNNRGVRQAELLGVTLKDVVFDCAFSSDLVRASDTAKAILRHHDEGPQLKHQILLRERALGNLEGKRPGLGEFKLAMESGDSSIETSADFSKRVIDWWNRDVLQSTLSKRREDGVALNILVATHGGVIASLVSGLMGSRKIVCAEGVVVGVCMNASVTVIEVHSDKKGTLVQFGDIAHLGELDSEALKFSADQTGTNT